MFFFFSLSRPFLFSLTDGHVSTCAFEGPCVYEYTANTFWRLAVIVLSGRSPKRSANVLHFQADWLNPR